jgi:hypothetical protein
MSAELAALFAKQKPGKVSKIATLAVPPYFEAVCGEAAWIPEEATVDTAMLAASATPTRRITRDLLV